MPGFGDGAGDAGDAGAVVDASDAAVTDASTAADDALVADASTPDDATTDPDASTAEADAAVAIDAAHDDAAPLPTVDAGAPDAARVLGPATAGMASWYDTSVAVGHCSYPALPADHYVASVSTHAYDGSEACGECVRVTGPRGTVTAVVVDQCPGCTDRTINLSEQAFAVVGSVSAGRIAVEWQPVPCPGSGDMVLGFDGSSSASWVGIQVRDQRIPVRSVEVQRGAAWTTLARQSDNYFTASGLGAGPFALRITATDGQQFVQTGVALHAGGTVATTHQFM